MRVLIVNNGVSYPAKLAALFAGAKIEVVTAADVSTRYPRAPHDCIVLTGSNQKPIPYFQTEIRPLLEWIVVQTQPLIGVCYGAELIAEAYGGTLHHLGPENKIKGFYTVATTPNEWHFPPYVCFYEAHQWIIQAVVPPLQPIITSSRGVLMFAHQSRPQIGIMFHPEKFADETDGQLVFRSIIGYLGLTH